MTMTDDKYLKDFIEWLVDLCAEGGKEKEVFLDLDGVRLLLAELNQLQKSDTHNANLKEYYRGYTVGLLMKDGQIDEAKRIAAVKD